MKVVIVDGQGGGIGKAVIDRVKNSFPLLELYAVGTNSIATAAMLRAGADFGATGENPIVYNSSDADVIIGPMGIVVANSLLGELTPKMAQAIGQSKAVKLLIPINKCNSRVVGVRELSLGDYVSLVEEQLKELLNLQ